MLPVKFTGLLLLLSVSCMPTSDKSKVEGESQKGSFVPMASKTDSRLMFSVPAVVGHRDRGLSLNDADDYEIEITGCASGWEPTIEKSNQSVDMYEFDPGCEAHLTSMTYDGKEYTETVGDPFTTFEAGDTAVFQAAADDTMQVILSRTLSDPTEDGDDILFTFYGYEALDEYDGINEALVSNATAHDSEVVPAPGFTVFSVKYVGMTAGGAGQFKFTMECDLDVDGANCDDQAFADMTYKLIEDTADDNEFTRADCVTAFDTEGSAIGENIAINGDDPNNDANDVPHGGFRTATLDGPDVMHEHPHMFLVIHMDGGVADDSADDSFTVVPVDVATVSYTP